MIGPELKGKDAVGTLDAFLGRGNLQDRAFEPATRALPPISEGQIILMGSIVFR